METTLNERGFAVSDGLVHIYNVNPVTGEYINQTDEFLSQGVGLPAHSYVDQPLKAKEGFAVCRTELGWEYKPDYRNDVVYSTESGHQLSINELGELPENVTLLAPKTPFDKWNGSAWITDLTAQRQAGIDAADAEKSRLRAIADAAIVPLSDAVEIDDATNEEIIKLKEWKKYRIELSRIDTSSAPDIKWPKAPA